MKLVIFGLSISSSWGNGHATLWRGLCRALHERDHRIIFFERDVPWYAGSRDLAQPEYCDLRLYARWEDVVGSASEELADTDAAIVTSYCPDGIAASELVLGSRAAIRVFYDLDSPVTLARLRDGQPVEYIGPRGLQDFDLVLSYTGGSALSELRTRLGARRVEPLYGGVDPDIHRPVPANPAYMADLSYLGTYAADRQNALTALFTEPARRLPQLRFLMGGALYPREFPWTSNIFFVRHVPPPDHPAFYCSSRLTLNVTRQAMADMGYCPSGRLFEAAACGAPVLSDEWEGLDQFFTPGSQILTARATEDAVDALALEDRELKRISTSARERALDEHTARHRAREMERLLEMAAAA